MTVKLSMQEYSCLTEEDFLPEHLRLAVHFVIESSNSVSLNCSDLAADEIRDLCGERLQEVGFDEDYNPNETGQLLLSLIDKLFLG